MNSTMGIVRSPFYPIKSTDFSHWAGQECKKQQQETPSLPLAAQLHFILLYAGELAVIPLHCEQSPCMAPAAGCSGGIACKGFLLCSKANLKELLIPPALPAHYNTTCSSVVLALNQCSNSSRLKITSGGFRCGVERETGFFFILELFTDQQYSTACKQWFQYEEMEQCGKWEQTWKPLGGK